jgi:hypothetical protein
MQHCSAINREPIVILLVTLLNSLHRHCTANRRSTLLYSVIRPLHAADARTQDQANTTENGGYYGFSSRYFERALHHQLHGIPKGPQKNPRTVAYTGILFGEGRVWVGLRQEKISGGGGVQQIQLRTEGRENGDRGAVAP